MAGEIRYPSPATSSANGMRAVEMNITEWPSGRFSIGLSTMTRDQVRAFGRQLLEITADADAAVPEGGWQETLDYLKACIYGYDLLLLDPEPGLVTWHEARDRGRRRITAACLALAGQEG